MPIKSRGYRPASYPSPPTVYQARALDARRFLLRTRRALYSRRQFMPVLLRETIDYQVGLESLEYRAGFIDALGAYVLLALEGCQLNLETWEVLADVSRR